MRRVTWYRLYFLHLIPLGGRYQFKEHLRWWARPFFAQLLVLDREVNQ